MSNLTLLGSLLIDDSEIQIFWDTEAKKLTASTEAVVRIAPKIVFKLSPEGLVYECEWLAIEVPNHPASCLEMLVNCENFKMQEITEEAITLKQTLDLLDEIEKEKLQEDEE